MLNTFILPYVWAFFSGFQTSQNSESINIFFEAQITEYFNFYIKNKMINVTNENSNSATAVPENIKQNAINDLENSDLTKKIKKTSLYQLHKNNNAKSGGVRKTGRGS